MTDESNNAEVVKPVEQSQQQHPDTNSTQEKNEEQQINWRKFREAREQERKAHEEALKRASQKEAEAKALKDAMEALLNKPDQRQQQDNYEEDDEEARIQKKVDAAISARERQYEAERQKREQADLPQTLKRNYSDFDKVCTEENLDYLEFHYPEVASAFKYMPEGVEKWGSIYKAVKKFVPNSSPGGDKQRIERNLSKPQSASAGGASQVGDTAPIMLDDKRRADNWARMQRVMRGGR